MHPSWKLLLHLFYLSAPYLDIAKSTARDILYKIVSHAEAKQL